MKRTLFIPFAFAAAVIAACSKLDIVISDEKKDVVTETVIGDYEDEDIDLVPDLDSRLAVDAEKSAIPEDVILNADRTLLVFPHTAAECTLVIESPDELELIPSDGYRLEVRQTGPNAFSVSKGLYAPGVEGLVTELRFRRKGLQHAYPQDRIVLELSPNPTVMEGILDFREDFTFDFGRYADNEFAVAVIPDGKVISAGFPDGEDMWLDIRPVQEAEGTYRIVGGWRPNDPTADGRKQSATIVIMNADGTGKEEYTVTRLNYGLPVTFLHGIWWCKYNAMGNSRDFEDQILSSDDPAAKAGKPLSDYLAECTAEEYASLWGWAYQGDSGIGMRVVDSDGLR